MKLSDKILIGLLGFVFIYMTAAFAEMRIKGDPNSLDESNSKLETMKVVDLGYLIIEDLDHRIKIIGSANSEIQVRSLTGDLLNKLKYELTNDTLKILELTLEGDPRVGISIHVPNQSLRGIMSNGNSLVFEDLNVDSVSLIQRSGWTTFQKNNEFDKLSIDISEKGYLNLYSAELKTLDIKIDSSDVGVYSPIDLLKGSMQNDSYLRVRGSKEILFKRDSTSRLYLN